MTAENKNITSFNGWLQGRIIQVDRHFYINDYFERPVDADLIRADIAAKNIQPISPAPEVINAIFEFQKQSLNQKVTRLLNDCKLQFLSRHFSIAGIIQELTIEIENVTRLLETEDLNWGATIEEQIHFGNFSFTRAEIASIRYYLQRQTKHEMIYYNVITSPDYNFFRYTNENAVINAVGLNMYAIWLKEYLQKVKRALDDLYKIIYPELLISPIIHDIEFARNLFIPENNPHFDNLYNLLCNYEPELYTAMPPQDFYLHILKDRLEMLNRNLSKVLDDSTNKKSNSELVSGVFKTIVSIQFQIDNRYRGYLSKKFDEHLLLIASANSFFNNIKLDILERFSNYLDEDLRYAENIEAHFDSLVIEIAHEYYVINSHDPNSKNHTLQLSDERIEYLIALFKNNFPKHLNYFFQKWISDFTTVNEKPNPKLFFENLEMHITTSFKTSDTSNYISFTSEYSNTYRFDKAFYENYLAPLITNLQNRINKQIEIYKTSKTKAPGITIEAQNKSFTYINENRDDRKERIKNVLDRLISNKFVADATTEKQLTIIFSGNKVPVKIHWTGKINALHYFIDAIHDHSSFEESVEPWKMACACFELIPGKSINPTKLKDSHRLDSQQTKDVLDSILNEL